MYAYILPILDGLTIFISLILAIVLRGVIFADGFEPSSELRFSELLFLAAYSGASILIFEYFKLYQTNIFATVIDHILQIVKSLVVVVLGIAVLAYFIRASFIVGSRLIIVYFSVIAAAFLIAGRAVAFRYLYLMFSRHDLFKRNVIVLGAGDIGRNLALNLVVYDYIGLNVVGFLDDDRNAGTTVFSGCKILGKVAEIEDFIKIYDIDEIIICIENAKQTEFIALVERCVKTGVTVKVSSPLYDVIPSRLEIEKYGDTAVVGVSHVGPSKSYEFQKRVFDALFAAFGVIVLLPVFAAIAVMIKLDSRGPVLFRQTRIGRNGKPFEFFKFRSMYLGSDDEDREVEYAEMIRGAREGNGDGDAPMKIVNESRITPVGRFLRRSSLDELPQLINVMLGDMSLVGPRPCLPYEWKYYEDWQKDRFSVTPGCTGMWQVFGRSKVSFQDMCVLNLFYAQNLSFRLDLWLIFKTIPVMVFGRGGK
jgi:undecaprenyl-phosphate galactose phosphotransferase